MTAISGPLFSLTTAALLGRWSYALRTQSDALRREKKLSSGNQDPHLVPFRTPSLELEHTTRVALATLSQSVASCLLLHTASRLITSLAWKRLAALAVGIHLIEGGLVARGMQPIPGVTPLHERLTELTTTSVAALLVGVGISTAIHWMVVRSLPQRAFTRIAGYGIDLLLVSTWLATSAGLSWGLRESLKPRSGSLWYDGICLEKRLNGAIRVKNGEAMLEAVNRLGEMSNGRMARALFNHLSLSGLFETLRKIPLADANKVIDRLLILERKLPCSPDEQPEGAAMVLRCYNQKILLFWHAISKANDQRLAQAEGMLSNLAFVNPMDVTCLHAHVKGITYLVEDRILNREVVRSLLAPVLEKLIKSPLYRSRNTNPGVRLVFDSLRESLETLGLA